MTIDERRKKLIFRSWHRGTREMGLLLGSFADAHAMTFDTAQLDAFERLLVNNDPDLYDWLCERGSPPEEENSDVMKLFLTHRFAA